MGTLLEWSTASLSFARAGISDPAGLHLEVGQSMLGPLRSSWPVLAAQSALLSDSNAEVHSSVESTRVPLANAAVEREIGARNN